VIATQHFFSSRRLPPCLRQALIGVSVWGRHDGKRRGKVLRRDHSLPFAGPCGLKYIDWPFNIPSFCPICLRAKRSAPIDEPSPESLVSARLQGSTYSRNEVISVSPDLARREKKVFSAASRLLSRTGLTVRRHPLSNYIIRTSSGHFTSWYFSAWRCMSRCTVILDISQNAYCLKVGPCEGSVETNCFQTRGYTVICKGSRQHEHFRRRSHECHVRTVRSSGYGVREISFVNALLDVSHYRRRSTNR
jgi:hypothetical protein